MSFRSVLLMLCVGVAIAPEAAQASTFSVGVGSGCTHSTIQAAVDAAIASPSLDAIHVTETLEYVNQSIVVRGVFGLRIIGGFKNCESDSPDGPRTVIDGGGGEAAPVFTIDDSGEVFLTRLDIRHGDSIHYGGGVRVLGVVDTNVTLANTRVAENVAVEGGGVAVLGANAKLILDSDSVVELNTAHADGGGIYCRYASLEMKGSRSRVTGNRATNGGGIAGHGCRATVATSSPFGDAAVIAFNTASRAGGGISLQEDSRLSVFTTDPDSPVGLVGNVSQGFGGALHVVDSNVGVINAIVDRNHAALGGGAAFVQARTKSTELWFDASDGGDPFTPRMVACRQPMACNRITNNSARTGKGSPSHGAAVMLLSEAAAGRAPSLVTFWRATLAGNSGQTLIRTQSDSTAYSYVDLHYSEVFGNTVNAGLIEFVAPVRIEPGADRVPLTIAGSTIAGNSIGGGSTLFSTQDVFATHNIIWQPGRRVLTAGTAGIPVTPFAYSIVNDTQNLGGSSTLLVADPRLANLSGGDLRLSNDSPAIDFAPAYGDETRDAGLRLIDLPQYSNRYGGQDLGAFERALVICCAWHGG